MQDILDSLVSPTALGMISTDPRQLANEAKQVMKQSGLPIMVFIDPAGGVLAQPAAYATEHPIAEIVGTYTPSVESRDLVDDLHLAVAPRLKAIGIIAHSMRGRA